MSAGEQHQAAQALAGTGRISDMLAGILRRLADRIGRAAFVHHTGGALTGQDWAELQQLAHEAMSFLESLDRHKL